MEKPQAGILAGELADHLVITSAACNGTAKAFHGNLEDGSGIVGHAAHQGRVKSQAKVGLGYFGYGIHDVCQILGRLCVQHTG